MALRHRNTRTSVRTKAVVSRLRVSVNVKSGQVLCSSIADSDGVCKLAKSTINNPVIGVAEKNANQGNLVTAFQSGVCDVSLASPATTSDVGKSVYLSSVDGLATIVPPTESGNSVIHIGYVMTEGNPAFILLDMFHVVHIN
jgi:predicted RecA/RadA family phage recombinase